MLHRSFLCKPKVAELLAIAASPVGALYKVWRHHVGLLMVVYDCSQQMMMTMTILFHRHMLGTDVIEQSIWVPLPLFAFPPSIPL